MRPEESSGDGGCRRTGPWTESVFARVAEFRRDPFPLAFSASHPQCRSLAETFGSERLANINLTHISTFNAANHCGVGLKEKFNIVRVPCAPSTYPSRAPGDRGGGGPQASHRDGLVLLLDPPSESLISGPAYDAVVVSAPDGTPREGAKPQFEVLPFPKVDTSVRDPVDHTYPFNTTRGVFSLEGLGDLEGGERYGRRQGCIQNYLHSLDDDDCEHGSGSASVSEILLVFLWVDRERGGRAHRTAIQHLRRSQWWLDRPHHSGQPPVFLHIYNGAEVSLFRHLFLHVPRVTGIMCIHSPWFPAREGEDDADGERDADEAFAAHDDDCEFVDIGTALGRCDTAEEVARMAALRYFGVSATPLTSGGLAAVLQKMVSLRHIAIYLNHAEQFQTAGCLGRLHHLRKLILHTCPHLVRLEGIEESRSLVELNLTSCINLSSITPLASVPTMQTLRINGCAAVSPAPFMEAILFSAPAGSCAGAGGGTAVLHRLNYLQLSELDNVCDNLPALRLLPRLTALDLHLTATDNKAVAVIAENCTHLQALSLAECFVISEIAPLAKLPCLSHLLLRNTTITDSSLRRYCEAPPLSLRVLDVSECDDLSDCRCVAEIPTLVRVNAQGTRITEQSAYDLVAATVNPRYSIGRVRTCLQTVDLRGCSQLRTLTRLFDRVPCSPAE